MTEMRVLGAEICSTTHSDLSLSGLLSAVATAVPHRLALVAGPRRLTYAAPPSSPGT